MKMQDSITLRLILLTTVTSFPVTPNEQKPNAHKLLLISFDGFRWNYDQDVDTPNMDRLVKEGVKAKYITPPFVTMTSPSHFTTITGKYISMGSNFPCSSPLHVEDSRYQYPMTPYRSRKDP